MTQHQILKEIFGFSDFRTGQKEIIDAILENKNVLAVMPTGAGKSLCYQIPALMKDKFSIVISPLISLMQDQVSTLNKNHEHAAFINSTLDYSQSQKVLQKIAQSKIKLLYLAPEKLNSHEFVTIIKNLNPYYIFIDEAHCISEWGHNFRPSYMNIKSFANSIGVKNISAFTATATPDVREDIIKQLEFKNPSVFVYGFERENISLNVEKTKNKKDRIVQILKNNRVPTIIYTSTRKNCEQLDEYLKKNNINSAYYHAGMTGELRKIIQDDFVKNNLDVIVATNAFGMGIDKKDIGTVIHYNMPGSIENLYQEFGRAGRTGDEAITYLFYSERDKYTQDFLISLNYPSIEQIRTAYDAILDYHKIAVNTISSEQLEFEKELIALLESKSISKNLLNSIINHLEQSNYLKLGNGFKQSPSFTILVTPEQLKNYIKQIRNKDFKEFILTLLQYYGSVPFTQSVRINHTEIMELLYQPKNVIDQQFIKLSEIGIIDYSKPNRLAKVEMLQERVPSDRLRLDIEKINSKAQHAKEKLDSVIEYCFSEECRFKFILNYFGESTTNYKCSKCDNCRGKSIDESATNEYLSELILRTFNEFQGGLTLSRLLGILTGKSKSQIAKSISTYQSCLHYNENQINNTLKTLVYKNILREINGKLFFDPIEELVDYEENNKKNSSVYESNLELFNKLREERNLAAKKFSQHPELICSDTLLRQIAKIKPSTPSQFLAIDNVNQRMFNKIGTEFIEIIQEHNSNLEAESNKDELPQHISQTYQLVKKGYSLTEISNLLKLPESIVSIQIETIIGYHPKGNYTSLVSNDEFESIRSEFRELNEDMKEVKSRLPSHFSYAKIRIVKAVLSASEA